MESCLSVEWYLERIFHINNFTRALLYIRGFPGSSVVKDLPASAGDMGLIPGLGRSSGGGNDNPLQYSCLGNPRDRRAWWATVHRATKSQTWLNTHTHTHKNTLCSDNEQEVLGPQSAYSWGHWADRERTKVSESKWGQGKSKWVNQVKERSRAGWRVRQVDGSAHV